MCAEIKRVLASDREDILEISRHIWEGHDYLPSVFDDWVKDPKSYTCGVEADGRLVAVANLRLIENGRTGWMEGLRVHPEHRGKGFADTLTRHLIEKAEDLGVQRLRYTTSTENEASLKLAEKFRFVKALEMGVFWHPNPKPIHSESNYPRIRKSNPSEVYKLLQDNPHLVPHRILFYDWKALDSTLKSLKMLGKSQEFYIALEEVKTTSLSIAYLRRGPEQSTWAFTIYATETPSFLSHLAHNIAEASRQGVSAVMGTYGIDFEKTLRDVGGILEEHWSTHMALLEKIICTETKIHS